MSGPFAYYHVIVASIVLGCMPAVMTGCIIPSRAQVVDTESVTQVEGEQRKRGEARRSGERRGRARRGDVQGGDPQGADDPRDDEPAVLVLKETSDRDEGAFCRATRPVLRELRGSVGRHIRCTAGRYVEAGYFGTTSDIAASSFYNACFNGSMHHGEEVMYHEQPIPQVASRIVATLGIGADSRLDLSKYGIVPTIYVLEHPRGVASATVEVSFIDPVVRSPTNLGYALSRLAADPEVAAAVRSSVSSCRARLCADESVYTSEIVSANPRIQVTLNGGEATGLRPIELNSAVSISGAGHEFVIRPARRVNLAAQFRPSRSELGNACLTALDVEPEPPGWTPPCSTILHRGIHVTLDGCQRSSRTVVTCRFSVLSPGRDRQLWIHVNGGTNEASTLVDDVGASRSARMGNAGNEWEDRGLRVPLVADVATEASLEFRDIASTATHASRVMLRAKSDRELYFDFRGVAFQTELGRCKSGDPT